MRSLLGFKHGKFLCELIELSLSLPDHKNDTKQRSIEMFPLGFMGIPTEWATRGGTIVSICESWPKIN